MMRPAPRPGTSKRDSRGGKGIGSTEGMGICHAYAPDGRCISLLKILLTNSCIFDCPYCINRKSSNVRRARFTAEEVVRLTLDFYKRNYIEGLFLSSGIIRSSNYTMEQIVEVARSLREDHDFRGYIHLKTIPDADPELVRQAGLYADRVSINVELPTAGGLDALAPEKDAAQIEGAMARHEAGDRRRRRRLEALQVGAEVRARRPIDPDDRRRRRRDRCATSSRRRATLYDRFGLRRVYYSAFSPIPDASAVLPLKRPPLMREHRLYQSDWLMRFYGFAPRKCRARPTTHGMLPLDIDPKLAWALKFREQLPASTSTARRAKCCCACRASAPRRSIASCRRGAGASCGSTMSRG